MDLAQASTHQQIQQQYIKFHLDQQRNLQENSTEIPAFSFNCDLDWRSRYFIQTGTKLHHAVESVIIPLDFEKNWSVNVCRQANVTG